MAGCPELTAGSGSSSSATMQRSDSSDEVRQRRLAYLERLKQQQPNGAPQDGNDLD